MHAKSPALLTECRAFAHLIHPKPPGRVLGGKKHCRHRLRDRTGSWPAALRRALFAPGKFHLPGPRSQTPPLPRKMVRGISLRETSGSWLKGPTGPLPPAAAVKLQSTSGKQSQEISRESPYGDVGFPASVDVIINKTEGRLRGRLLAGVRRHFTS